MQDIGFPTSKSVLWHWAKERYRTWPWEKWSNIPNRITASTWLAERYAEKIKEISLKTKKKVVVVEWGGGTGAFAYCLLNRLTSDDLAHYLICDLQDDMPSTLSAHPQMRPYYLEGRVGFYVADFLLVHEWTAYIKQRFPDDDMVFVMIHNYMLDALPTDVWYVADDHAAPKPAAMIIDGKGYAPWINRAIADMRFRLELGEAWEPEESWYQAVMPCMQSIEGRGAIYSVPVGVMAVWSVLRDCFKSCVCLVSDIPLHRVPLDDIVSPYFVDGMVAGVVDFELLGIAMNAVGADVWQGRSIPGVELRMSAYSWGVKGLIWNEWMSMPTFWCLMQHIQSLNGTWSMQETFSYLELSQFDVWLLGCFVDRSAGIDIVYEQDRLLWLSYLNRVEKDIYWIHGNLDWLHIGTLYRWQKEYRLSYQALMNYVKFSGYDHAYWYCMGYWCFDQGRYRDAIDAWHRASDNDEHYAQLLKDDLEQAKHDLKMLDRKY